MSHGNPTRRHLILASPLLIAACSGRSDAAVERQHAVDVPMPVHAADWQQLSSARWALELRLPPEVHYVAGPSSDACAPDSTYEEFREYSGATAVQDDTTGVEIYFVPEAFSEQSLDLEFGWTRPTEWRPEAEPGWYVSGEGPSGAALLDGNGWIGLGGEPLVKVFLDEETCLDMMDVDSVARDSIRDAMRAEGGVSCGSVHDNRPRYIAAVRRPADRCYLVLRRTDGEPVGDIAETVRFIENGRRVAPVSAVAPRPFSFHRDVGMVVRTDHWSGCLIVRDPLLRPGTALTIVETNVANAVPRFMQVGEPDSDGCGPAPAGHISSVDTMRWYAYRLDLEMGGDDPAIALVGNHFSLSQFDSLKTVHDSIWKANGFRDPLPLRIDLDRNGIAESFAEERRPDSIVFTVRSGTAANAPLRWRGAFPNLPPKQISTGSNSYTLEYIQPPTATLPSDIGALTGVAHRNAHGIVCLTITNPRVPYLTPVHIVAGTSAQRLIRAHIGWRVPGGCRADVPRHTWSYGVMLVDSSALAVGEFGVAVLDDTAGTVSEGRARIDIDRNGAVETLAIHPRDGEVLLTATTQGESKPRWTAKVAVPATGADTRRR